MESIEPHLPVIEATMDNCFDDTGNNWNVLFSKWKPEHIHEGKQHVRVPIMIKDELYAHRDNEE